MPGAVPLLERLGVHPAGMPLRGVDLPRRRAAADLPLRARHRARGAAHDPARRAAPRGPSVGVTRFVRHGVEASSRMPRASRSPAGIQRAAGCSPPTGCTRPSRGSLGLALPGAARPPALRAAPALRVEPWTDLIEVHWARAAEVYVTPAAPDGRARAARPARAPTSTRARRRPRARGARRRRGAGERAARRRTVPPADARAGRGTACCSSATPRATSTRSPARGSGSGSTRRARRSRRRRRATGGLREGVAAGHPRLPRADRRARAAGDLAAAPRDRADRPRAAMALRVVVERLAR